MGPRAPPRSLSNWRAPCGWGRSADGGARFPETLITLHLEQQLTKQEIFEDYANAIYLGHQGSFSIHGFGEAASVYLAKDLSQVTAADAALLAGLIQSPIGRNPFRYPDRARTRRNLVLKAMRENGYLTEQEYQDAAASPLRVVQGAAESTDAPFFVDLVNETLQNRFQDYDFQSNSFRVYTTLDMTLQRDAVEAVRIGIQETDAQWKRRSKKYGTEEMPLAQVALVVLDTETGKVKALVGGRSYGNSQLNHATSKRQPGSSFKPFVYTAAFSAALRDGGQVITPATTVVDEPTTFMFDDKPYEPADFGDQYAGAVTLRRALAHSMNIPAVKVAEMVGYDKVAAIARAVGLNVDIQPTPSIALGAYEVMPIEIAGAYTVFPNGGILKKPGYIDTIRNQEGRTVFQNQPQEKQAIDPRVAYLMVSMMEEVLRTGTAAGVRGRGFVLPAAGKTGTSRDGWFAGFTSKLICVVWVGFDDNRDFKLEGARSALPYLDRVHEAGAPAPRVSQCARVRGARGSGDGGHRRGHRTAGHARLPQGSERSVYRRDATCRSLPAAWRRAYPGGGMGTGGARVRGTESGGGGGYRQVGACNHTGNQYFDHPGDASASGTCQEIARLFWAAEGYFSIAA